MRPLSVSCTVDAPRERVFTYLSDIANHAGFEDHFLEDFRLERLDSRGVGAAARFRISNGLTSMWAELVITELDPPYRIVAEGGAGRIGRIRLKTVFTLTPHGEGMTRVELTWSSEPPSRIDRLREHLLGRLWLRWQLGTALRRLRDVLEEGRPSTHAAGVAAG